MSLLQEGLKIIKKSALPLSVATLLASGCAGGTKVIDFPDCKIDPQKKYHSEIVETTSIFNRPSKISIAGVIFEIDNKHLDEIKLSGKANSLNILILEENAHFQVHDQTTGRDNDINISPREQESYQRTVEITSICKAENANN